MEYNKDTTESDLRYSQGFLAGLAFILELPAKSMKEEELKSAAA